MGSGRGQAGAQNDSRINIAPHSLTRIRCCQALAAGWPTSCLMNKKIATQLLLLIFGTRQGLSHIIGVRDGWLGWAGLGSVLPPLIRELNGAGCCCDMGQWCGEEATEKRRGGCGLGWHLVIFRKVSRAQLGLAGLAGLAGPSCWPWEGCGGAGLWGGRVWGRVSRTPQSTHEIMITIVSKESIGANYWVGNLLQLGYACCLLPLTLKIKEPRSSVATPTRPQITCLHVWEVRAGLVADKATVPI